MKISVVSMSTNPTPAPSYGCETYWWDISEQFAKLGHDVTLYAIGGSQTPTNGKLRLINSQLIDMDPFRKPGWEGMIDMVDNDRQVVKDYYDELNKSDIIVDCSHNHYVSEYFRDYHGKTNSVNLLNGYWWWNPRNPFNVVVGCESWRNAGLKGLTGWEGTEYEKGHGYIGKLKDARIVPWGVDTSFYKPDGYAQDDYYLWISRFHPSKGTDIVINLAKKLGFRLILAGSTEVGDHVKYSTEYLKSIEGYKNIEFFHNPRDSKHHERKRELYRRARGFLFPVRYAEAFGLVVVEALACGCPVIATNRGSIPDILIEGKTGFIVNDFEEKTWKDAMDKINKINPMDCVNDVDERWNVEYNALVYLELFERVINGERW